MANRKVWRWCALAAVLAILGILLAVSLHRQRSTCMGVPILSRAEDEALSWDDYRDMDVTLTFRGEPVAAHSEGRCVLIPQKIEEDTAFHQLSGVLSAEQAGYTLAFAPDAAFDDLAAAVAEDHVFYLVVFDEEGYWSDFAVTFTTLPVLRLDGEYAYTNEEYRDVMEGQLCLWVADDPDTGHPSVKTSALQWKVRGDTTAGMAKVPWKLSLKDSGGDNRNLSLLGMGEDDDWILNAMALDDTDMKEKLFMDVWNELAADTEYDYPMSRGEYVEVVINGEYMGLYLLQRRLDEKLLELTDEDILLKGTGSWEPVTPAESYEILCSPLSDEETLALMEGVWCKEDTSILHVENYADVNLFLQAFSAPDNAGYNNMFYLLRPRGEGWALFMIPWDTDMSLGVTWIEDFAYDYDYSLWQDCHRLELNPALEQFPELWELFCARWEELREHYLTVERLHSFINQYEETLSRSGATLRDNALWGLYYEGADTVEGMRSFVEDRLAYLDEYYTVG